MGESKTKAILIVDDSRSARLVASRIVGDLGFRVRVAADGFEAVRQLEAFEDIFLVLTDLVMPQMSGLSLIQFINSRFPERSISTAVLTVERSDAVVARMKELGVLGVLTKPLNGTQLVDLLAQSKTR